MLFSPFYEAVGGRNFLKKVPPPEPPSSKTFIKNRALRGFYLSFCRAFFKKREGAWGGSPQKL